MGHHEKRKSLPLYEEAFPEDKGAYAEYYYAWKGQDNEILVLTDSEAVQECVADCQKDQPVCQDRICAMLHLNPYLMWIATDSITLHYIVAVATSLPYRRQGCMRKLMLKAFSWLYDRKEPFTYLMPADTAYYKPFGFRVIYDQKPVSFPEDVQEANLWAKEQFDVVTLRDERYLLFLEAEPQLCGNSVLSESAEALSEEAGAFLKSSGSMDAEEDFCKVSEGAVRENRGWKPQIMCRIVHAVRLLECMRAEYDKKIYIQIHDSLISENSGWYCWMVSPVESIVTRLDDVSIARIPEINRGLGQDGQEVSCLTLEIEELAEQLFGIVSLNPALFGVRILRKICINEEV